MKKINNIWNLGNSQIVQLAVIKLLNGNAIKINKLKKLRPNSPVLTRNRGYFGEKLLIKQLLQSTTIRARIGKRKAKTNGK